MKSIWATARVDLTPYQTACRKGGGLEWEIKFHNFMDVPHLCLTPLTPDTLNTGEEGLDFCLAEGFLNFDCLAGKESSHLICLKKPF